eukprot:scaffold1843_cov143-Skeletonema_menzelii.AAC.19
MGFSQLTGVAAVIISFLLSVDAFQIQQHDSTTSSLSRSNNKNKILLPSRRDILISTITTATSSLLLNQPVQAKDESMNYQAVWFDPKHPNGYRVLFGDDHMATLLLRDEPSDKELVFPVKVIKEQGKETRLLFDGGTPSSVGNDGAVEGIFTRNRDKIRIISFNSNEKNNSSNNSWINKKFEGPIGVYKDSTKPTQVIIIRQIKGSDCVVEFRDSERNNEVTSTFKAKAGNTFTFDFPDRGEDTAVFSLFRRTLTFEDGTVWTKY